MKPLKPRHCTKARDKVIPKISESFEARHAFLHCCAEVRVQVGGALEHGAAPGGQAAPPVAQGRLQRGDASGGADLGDQRRDLPQQVAAPPELVGQPDVPYVGRAVDPVARLRVAARPDQSGVLPFAQGGRAEAEPSGQGPMNVSPRSVGTGARSRSVASTAWRVRRSGLVVDDYITTGAGTLDDVMERGFSHRFGTSPANRELVRWLRAYNEEHDEKLRFSGFDGPVEYWAASPRQALTALHALLDGQSARASPTISPISPWSRPSSTRSTASPSSSTLSGWVRWVDR
jgi:hypothetical protein